MTDNHIDAAIDRAVRDMMSVDAPEQIRARVLAGLERRDRESSVYRRGSRSPVPAALLVAFVLIQLAWPDERHRALAARLRVAPVGTASTDWQV